MVTNGQYLRLNGRRGGQYTGAAEQVPAMSVCIMVTRGFDRNLELTNEFIAFSEWVDLVERDPSLRIRTEPYVWLNPATGQRITARTGDADSEIDVGGEWKPFLRYDDGELTIRFLDEMLDPRNPLRMKIAAIAGELNALITSEGGEELLRW